MTYRQPFVGEWPITQRYGEVVPGVTWQGKPHTGIDYGCPEGTAVLASAAGVVMFAEFDSYGFGNTIIIQHGDGKATLYAHLSYIGAKYLQRVEQGDAIGLSGATGNATGPHLHFEARERWCDYRTHRDPVTFLPMMSVDDSTNSAVPAVQTQLKGAEAFAAGDLLEVVCPDGVKAFFDPGFSYERMTTYQQGTPFYFSGDTAVRKDNGLTYLRVVPASFAVWVAVNDGETQILDKAEIRDSGS